MGANDYPVCGNMYLADYENKASAVCTRVFSFKSVDVVETERFFVLFMESCVLFLVSSS